MIAQESQDQKPGLMERIQQFIEEDRKKIGGMTLGAMARLGLAELREAFSLGGNIEQPTPYGMYGTLTPGEVFSARQDDPQAPQREEESSMNTNQSLPTPSQIAANPTAYLQEQGNGMGPDRGQGNQQGQGHGSVHGDRDHLPSPSEIASNPTAYLPQQEHGQEHEHDHGRGM